MGELNLHFIANMKDIAVKYYRYNQFEYFL
jgi:hypothetical protein